MADLTKYFVESKKDFNNHPGNTSPKDVTRPAWVVAMTPLRWYIP